jgi:hypothetical protein
MKGKTLHITGGLAQAGVWLARKFVRIFNICARANGSETPAFAKPLLRWLQPEDSSRVIRGTFSLAQRDNSAKNSVEF